MIQVVLGNPPHWKMQTLHPLLHTPRFGEQEPQFLVAQATLHRLEID